MTFTPINPQTVTVTRRAANTVVDFHTVPGAASTFSLTADIQPMSGKEMETFPECRDAKRSLKIFYDGLVYALQIADPETKVRGDRFTYQGDEFELVAIKDYVDSVLDHQKAIANMVPTD